MPNTAKGSKPPVRVLHLANGYIYGGVETALVMMARHRRLCPVLVPEFALVFEGRLAEELRNSGVEARIIGNAKQGLSGKASELRECLGRLLDTVEYDAVICHMLMVQAVFGGIVNQRGIPCLLHTHGVTPPVWEWWASQVPPDHIIYNSRHMKDTSVHLFPGVSGSVVYYPALPPEICADPLHRRALRAAQGARDEDLVVVHVARLEAMKGHRELLRAIARLRDLEGWAVWFVGGPQREQEHAYLLELTELARALGIDDRVRFLGQRTDVPYLLRAADVYCQPNTATESFGMSFIEAEFAGLPVVTTAFGGALEAVGEGCGILVPPDDPDALTDALRRVLTEPQIRQRARELGPLHAARLCDPATNLNRLYGAVRSVVESSDARGSTDHSASSRTRPGVSSTDRSTETDSTR
jgi:glycosyltransferase involved in cell wall biosynthesis